MPGTHTLHTGFISRLNAWLLNRGTDRYNERVHERKQRLFSGLSGRVLEIGAGTGANLEYYPSGIELIALEPNPYMQEYLKDQAAKNGRKIEIHTGVAEEIPLSDVSVDSVISTLVLCSVEDLSKSLSEILRVLKPGGTFRFIEHVAAPEKYWLRYIQNVITPCWKYLVDGCHPNRETWKVIENAGFNSVNLEHTRLKLPVVSPHIIGSATKSQ